jgi:hypothetical protein
MESKKYPEKKSIHKLSYKEITTLQFLISHLKQRFYLIQNLPETSNGEKPYFDLKTKK